MTEKPLVVVINGKGGSGKDTICDIVSKHYKVKNVSSITIIKQAAEILGWTGGKNLVDRKFLSDLKRLSIEYNNMPFLDIVKKYQIFCSSGLYDVMFVHIREAKEIDAFLSHVKRDGRANITTLLIECDWLEDPFGNESDDNVSSFDYEHVFYNNCLLDDLEDKFMEFFEKEIMKKSD